MRRLHFVILFVFCTTGLASFAGSTDASAAAAGGRGDYAQAVALHEQSLAEYTCLKRQGRRVFPEHLAKCTQIQGS